MCEEILSDHYENSLLDAKSWPDGIYQGPEGARGSLLEDSGVAPEGALADQLDAGEADWPEYDPFWDYEEDSWPEDEEDFLDDWSDELLPLKEGRKLTMSDKMKSLLKSKWLYIVVLGLLSLLGGGAYAEQIKQLLFSILGS